MSLAASTCWWLKCIIFRRKQLHNSISCQFARLSVGGTKFKCDLFEELAEGQRDTKGLASHQDEGSFAMEKTVY